MVPWPRKEDADEFGADDLALLLGVGDAGELAEEAVGGVDVDEVGAELLAEDADDLLGLALAEEAVVDVDTGELLADGADEEGRDDGAVDAAGEGEEHLLVADLGADGLDLVGDEVVHVPVALGAGLGDEGLEVGLGGAVVHAQGGQAGVEEGLGGLDHLAFVGAAGAGGEDEAAEVGDGGELPGGEVVGVELGVDAGAADGAGQLGGARAAQVDDGDGVLVHGGPFLNKVACRRRRTYAGAGRSGPAGGRRRGHAWPAPRGR